MALFSFGNKPYSLKKSQSVLLDGLSRLKKRRSKLDTEAIDHIEELFFHLHSAITEKNRERASEEAKKLEVLFSSSLKKTFPIHLRELIVALGLALSLAAIIRQDWFELYEIPTGSMRPTFKEQDHVLVSKTAFGLNVPFSNQHFWFDSDLVKRQSTVVISGEGIDLPDTNTVYFGIFPGKKLYLKRCVAKPGDTVYFYGGQIFGIDNDGNDVSDIATEDNPYFLEHIPFMHFEGKIQVIQPSNNDSLTKLVFRHMNIPIAKLSFDPTGQFNGQIHTEKGWVREAPLNSGQQSYPTHFRDIWGIGNIAQARLLSAEQLPLDAIQMGYKVDHAPMYLEIKHSPFLPQRASPSYSNRVAVDYGINSLLTWIPILPSHIEKLKESLYTCRFVVQDQLAWKYRAEKQPINRQGISLPGIPDGTYEFYSGKAYRIGKSGWSELLDASHPLCQLNQNLLITLFNFGIEFDDLLVSEKMLNASKSTFKVPFPLRYAYFRNKDLYVMGHCIVHKDDPVLVSFNDKEAEYQKKNPTSYTAFIDKGPPLKQDGTLDKEFIHAFGLKIPQDGYLVLGDNHAMSADSRYFGFAPEQNLKGRPVWIFWPPSPHWGMVDQPELPFWRLPNVVVLSLVSIASAIAYLIHRKRQAALLNLISKRKHAPYK